MNEQLEALTAFSEFTAVIKNERLRDRTTKAIAKQFVNHKGDMKPVALIAIQALDLEDMINEMEKE